MSEQGTTKDQGMLEAGQACENTDRHLWPLVSKPDDPYESIHVTKEGNIGINVCGNVIVQSLRAWHAAAGGTPGRALGDEQRPSKEQIQPCPHGRTPDLCRQCMRAEIDRLQRDLDKALSNHTADLSAAPEPRVLGCIHDSAPTTLCQVCYPTHEPLPDVNPMGRDADWVLAIGHALGLDSGYTVPIVPRPEVFRELFAEVRRRASQPPGTGQ